MRRHQLEKSTIRIQRSSQYIAGKGIFTKETKTQTSDRTIRLPGAAFEMLKTYRAWQNEERLKLGDYWQPSKRLFTTIEGKAIHPDTITGWFSEFIEKNNLPKVTIHSLRHTNITLLIMAGSAADSGQRAGHSSTVTTSLIYSHAIQSADDGK